LNLGRALEQEGCFKHVHHRIRLRDHLKEYYTLTQDSSIAPTGVFLPLSTCYSPTCSKAVTCYSLTCPRKTESKIMGHLSSNMDLDEIIDAKEWILTVSNEISSNLSKQECKRQETIMEIIKTEAKFVRLLGLYQKFLDMLLMRQKENPVFDKIGDLCACFFPNFECYLEYGRGLYVAVGFIKDERARNSQFEKLLNEFQNDPEVRKLSQSADGILLEPRNRIGRYKDLLTKIQKLSSEHHSDYYTIPAALSIIVDISMQTNEESGIVEDRLKILEFEKLTEMPLEERQVIHLIRFHELDINAERP
jgi:hypothetical protein